jgi:hypothetical protein
MEMGRMLVVATALTGLAVALIHPALAQNGRPPPIKIGQPSPTPSASPTPIKIGKPTPTPTQTPITIGTKSGGGGGGGSTGASGGPLTGVDTNKMLNVALNMPLNPTTFSWAMGIGDVMMEPTKTHICLVTEITGNFAGAEHVYMRIKKDAPGGPRYIIGGSGGQKELKISATCARNDRFTPGMFSDKNVGYVELPLGIDTGCGPVQYAGMAQDNAGLFVREMAGKFRGGGEAVDMGVHANGTIGMRVSACSGWAGGAIGGVTFGNPLSKTPASEGFGGTIKYYGKNGPTAQHALSTWLKTDKGPIGTSIFGGGDKFTTAGEDNKLIPANKALCGIVMISGKFQGFGEHVRVYIRDGYWQFDVQSLAEDSPVFGAVRCIARDQR